MLTLINTYFNNGGLYNFWVLVISGIIAFNYFTKNRKEQKTDYQSAVVENDRILKLVVVYGFGDRSEVISENATAEIIRETMNSIDWGNFHIVYLEDNNGNYLDVGGSLYEDGLASSFQNDDEHLLLVNPPETVKEMVEILLDFHKGEKVWREKYHYN